MNELRFNFPCLFKGHLFRRDDFSSRSRRINKPRAIGSFLGAATHSSASRDLMEIDTRREGQYNKLLYCCVGRELVDNGCRLVGE